MLAFSQLTSQRLLTQLVHVILFKKIKEIPINTYIFKWKIDFLHRRFQRVVSNGTMSSFLPINRGVFSGYHFGTCLVFCYVERH